LYLACKPSAVPSQAKPVWEEDELFPEAEETLGDAIEILGGQMKERKEALMASLR
jgi:hypothetical protein